MSSVLVDSEILTDLADTLAVLGEEGLAAEAESDDLRRKVAAAEQLRAEQEKVYLQKVASTKLDLTPLFDAMVASRLHTPKEAKAVIDGMEQDPTLLVKFAARSITHFSPRSEGQPISVKSASQLAHQYPDSGGEKRGFGE